MRKTILLAEQNAAKAFEISDHIYVMELGRIIKTGIPAELAEDPDIKKAYLGI